MERERQWLGSDLGSEDAARKAAAHAQGVPYVRLAVEDIPIEVLLLIPEPFARSQEAVAYSAGAERVEVALLDIAAWPALSALDWGERKVVPRLTDRQSLTRALLRYQKLLKEKYGKDIEGALRAGDYEGLVDALLSHALASRAHALHLEPREHGLFARYRIGERLHDAMTLPAHAATGLFARLSSLAQSGSFTFLHGGEKISARFSTIPTVVGQRGVVHVTREGRGSGFTLEALGLHGEALERLRAALHKPGLILLSGPAGSGKTTLLYTLLDMCAPRGSVASVEESVEYRLPGVAQTEVNDALGLTTAAALRALLRQDGDVIGIQKITDSETALLAAQAASRGVTVIAALEAPSAAAGILQMLSFDVEPLLLASALRVSVGLRLVSLLGPEREAHTLARIETSQLERCADFGAVLAILKEEGLISKSTAWKDLQFYRGESAGRTGIHEVYAATAAFKEYILRGAEVEELEAQARADGNLVLAEDALFKAAQGIVSIDEAIALAGE